MISGAVEIDEALEAGRMPIPKSCSTLKKNVNFRKSQVLDCYAERNQPCKEEGESYWLDSGRVEPGREMERIRIQELEEEIDSNYNSCKGEDQSLCLLILRSTTNLLPHPHKLLLLFMFTYSNQEEEGRKQRPRREIGLDNINGVGDVTNLDITVETVLKIHGRLNRKKDGGLRVSPLKVGTPVRPIPGVGLNTGTRDAQRILLGRAN
ncbi:hypothetical protein D5F01_LYC24190 [Larimichthys crocea]|uniref:Uncharacterized protein n=1 Tax=Larimichthys crocea TaxID=215358 RepID=A0A6G0HFI4_LARCR|nr:hypothetical protein D5F01_LYC24190 [Larimichthys crocea]